MTKKKKNIPFFKQTPLNHHLDNRFTSKQALKDPCSTVYRHFSTSHPHTHCNSHFGCSTRKCWGLRWPSKVLAALREILLMFNGHADKITQPVLQYLEATLKGWRPRFKQLQKEIWFNLWGVTLHFQHFARRTPVTEISPHEQAVFHLLLFKPTPGRALWRINEVLLAPTQTDDKRLGWWSFKEKLHPQERMIKQVSGSVTQTGRLQITGHLQL